MPNVPFDDSCAHGSKCPTDRSRVQRIVVHRIRDSVHRRVHRGQPLDVAIECTGYDRPHRVASRSVMTGAVVEGEVRCRPAPAGTRAFVPDRG